MGMLFDFIKTAGETLGLIDEDDTGQAKAAGAIQANIEQLDAGVENVQVSVEGDKIVLAGRAATQEAMEKAVLTAGNVEGIAQVESNIEVAEPTAEDPQFYTVQSGDYLSKIAKNVYGDANRYMEIFEANRPMLSDPEKIYPGQVLRIPRNTAKAAA